jgi:glutamate racemase
MRAPIAVFDSGVGGLTVVGALRRELPGEAIVYLGDTARVPYGGKSQKTIERYSEEIASMLVSEGAKMVVVACNTASALALAHLREVLPVPVEGVIDPGVRAAMAATKSGHVAVIGTKATIGSGAYEKGLRAASPDIRVTGIACPLLVPLIEEGMFEDPVTDQMLARYLDPLLSQGIDTLVLGCTHYPLLKSAIARIVGSSVSLVDSAENCGLAVRSLLRERNSSAAPNQHGQLDVALTDATEGFLRTAARALDLEISRVTLKTGL